MPDNDSTPGNVAEQIADVTNEIASTPKDEQDREWRNGINSALTTIQAQLTALETKAGQSPEVMALSDQVTRLTEKVEALLAKPQEPPKSGADGNPTLETQKDELSGPTVVPPAKAKKEKIWV